jgi:hypothetical protein
MDRPWVGHSGGTCDDAGGSSAFSPDTFLLIAEQENIGTAANGDYVAVTVDDGSWFDASRRAVSASGDFTHFAPDGTVRGAGTWTATFYVRRGRADGRECVALVGRRRPSR